MRFVVITFICILVVSLLPTNAQPLSLPQCLKRVNSNSSTVRKTNSAIEQRVWEVNQAKDAFIPSLSLSNQHNISTGRVLDPTTYQFVTNRTVYDMSATIGGSLTLFDGMERWHQVKKAEISLRNAELEVERVRNNLELEVTRLFLEILMDKEAIEVCKNKVDLLEKHEELIQRKVDLDAATTGDLLNIQADVTRANVERASALNELNLDKVALCELLVIEDWEHFDVSGEDITDVVPQLWNADDLAASARNLPQIRQQEMAVKQAQRDVQIASAAYFPTLRINAGYGSTFSNARVKTTGEDYMFQDQFRDNMSSYVTATVSIPILSTIKVSHAVKARKAAVQSSVLEYEHTLLSLDKEVKQAIIQTDNAFEKYQLLAIEVEKAAEALRQTEVRFEAGAATYYDYQIAVGNLFQARAERLRARFEYIYRTKIMDYYSGKPLY